MQPSLVQLIFKGVLGYCPHCGKVRIFKGIYAVYERCPNCNTPLEDKPGDFTGAAYINSLLTGIVAVTLGVIGVLFTDLPVGILTAIAIPILWIVATIFHWPIKGVWVAITYYLAQIDAQERHW